MSQIALSGLHRQPCAPCNCLLALSTAQELTRPMNFINSELQAFITTYLGLYLFHSSRCHFALLQALLTATEPRTVKFSDLCLCHVRCYRCLTFGLVAVLRIPLSVGSAFATIALFQVTKPQHQRRNPSYHVVLQAVCMYLCGNLDSIEVSWLCCL